MISLKSAYAIHFLLSNRSNLPVKPGVSESKPAVPKPRVSKGAWIISTISKPKARSEAVPVVSAPKPAVSKPEATSVEAAVSKRVKARS